MMPDLMQILFVLWAEVQKVVGAVLPVLGYAALAYFAARFTLAIAQAIVRTTKTLDTEAKMAILRAEAFAKAQVERLEQISEQKEALEASTKMLEDSSPKGSEETSAGAPGQNPQQAPTG